MIRLSPVDAIKWNSILRPFLDVLTLSNTIGGNNNEWTADDDDDVEVAIYKETFNEQERNMNKKKDIEWRA